MRRFAAMTQMNKTGTATGALLVHELNDQRPQRNPLTVPISQACQLSGYGPTTIWKFIRDGRLDIVRVAGVRRTLISYYSLARLLAPACPSEPTPRKRGRRRKISDADGRAL
jgi:hypothetical protein